ncbi:MAG: LPS export ABC transporter periplasmic protein LptC [Nitrospirota bacterium]
MKFYKVTAVVLVAAVIAVGSYLLMRGTNITIPSLFHPALGPRLIMSMDGFRFTQSENGKISWRMNARSADLFENKEAQLQDIKIVFTSPENKESTILGETGTMDTTSGNASIRRVTREVRVITSDGYLLTTDSLFWKAGERVVWTADPFKLLGSEIYLEGIGMSANVDMRTITVKNDVKAVLQE